MPLVAGGNQPIQYIAIDELIVAIHSIILNNFTGKFILASQQSVSYGLFYKSLAKHFKYSIKTVHIPLFIMRIAVFFNSFLPKPFITKDSLEGLIHMSYVNPEESLKKLGLQIRPLDESLTQNPH